MKKNEPTHLAYLDNPLNLEGESVVVDFGEDEKGKYLLLDKTWFYPQGGGQPSDTGCIEISGGKIDVFFVRFVQGEVRHYHDASIGIILGDSAISYINKELRELHSKIHTAGHLMDNMIAKMPDVQMKGVKGFHFPEGAYVEFIGVKPEDTPKFIERLENDLALAIRENHSVKEELVNIEQLRGMGIYIPPNLPEDKPLRVVTIGDFEPIPCGGTHVRFVEELGTVKIRKVKAKKDRVKVSYQVS